MIVGASFAREFIFKKKAWLYRAFFWPNSGVVNFSRRCWHAAPWVGLLNPFLSGPSGYPRECFSLIETGLIGHPALAPSIFIPENRLGLKNSLGG